MIERSFNLNRILIFATIALILDLLFILFGITGTIEFNMIRIVFAIILTFAISTTFFVAFLIILINRKKNH